MKRLYRIVHDNFAGFEVQWRWRWLPIWWQAGGINTWSSLEHAERHVHRHAKSRSVAKYFGTLP